MAKASLYVNSKGYEVTRHSYSGSSEFNDCARRYYLHRVAGWQDREQSAAMEFGKALENAVTEFHRAGEESARKIFLEQWFQFADNKDLKYSKKHLNWENLQAVGLEMIRLYAIKYPHFPYTVPNPDKAFQVNLPREVFPGTDLAGIELTSYIDLIAKLKPGSYDPALNDDRGIFDMKVSSSRCPSLISLDPQLRTYSWVTGIPTVGFLWFEICSRSLGVGDEVTLLEQITGDNGQNLAIAFSPGHKVYILAEDFNTIPLVPESVYVVNKPETVDGLKAIKGQKAVDKQARLDYIQKNSVPVPVSALTTQSVEVRTATISEESRDDIRKQVESDVVRIVHASEQNFWPQQSGIRWPHDRCVTCYLRGICTNNDALRDELATRDLKGDQDAF
jgi:PD-(D/E)XK nuclease superfamily protein